MNQAIEDLFEKFRKELVHGLMGGNQVPEVDMALEDLWEALEDLNDDG